MLNPGDKVLVDGQVVKVTGVSGTYYRVFIPGGNMRHDWYPVAYLDKQPRI